MFFYAFIYNFFRFFSKKLLTNRKFCVIIITEIKGSDRTLEANVMYRCDNCGHLFEDGEQAVWHENYDVEIGRETFDGCPICKGGYEEVYQCHECGDWHSDDELYEGWCEKCLRKSINYDTFLEYCEANKDENYLDMFVMCYLLTCDEFPEYPSWEFHQLMIQVYQDRAEKAKENEILYGFIADCEQFIMEDDGHTGRENYAEWLNEREEK